MRGRQRVGIFLLYTRYLRGDTVVHHIGRILVDVSERVLERILADPYGSGQIVSAEVILRLQYGLLIRIFLHFQCRFLDAVHELSDSGESLNGDIVNLY